MSIILSQFSVLTAAMLLGGSIRHLGSRIVDTSRDTVPVVKMAVGLVICFRIYVPEKSASVFGILNLKCKNGEYYD